MLRVDILSGHVTNRWYCSAIESCLVKPANERLAGICLTVHEHSHYGDVNRARKIYVCMYVCVGMCGRSGGASASGVAPGRCLPSDETSLRGEREIREYVSCQLCSRSLGAAGAQFSHGVTVLCLSLAECIRDI